jgi:hypothetical protein
VRGGERPSLDRLAFLIIGLLIVWKLVFLLFFTVHTRYVMDEYIQASYSLLIPDGFYTRVDPIKTVLYIYYFDVARLLAGDANQLMRYARLEALLLAFGMIALCGIAARRLWRSSTATVFSIAVLLSFSNFLEHSFRIRSDTLAAFFSIAALIPLLTPELEWPRVLTSGLLIGLAFISTQKAAYAAVAIGLAILVHSGTLLTRLRRGFVYTGGFLVVLTLYAVYFGGTDVLRVFRMVALGPVPLAVSAGAYAGGSLRMYAWRSLIQNPIAYALCAAGAAASAWNWKNTGPAERAALVASAVITAAYFLHSQPWPYVFVHCLPFLAVFSGRTLAIAPTLRPSVIALLAAAALIPSLMRNVHYTQFDNAQQELTVAQAESLLGPNDRYQDGIGMVPTRRPAWFTWWDGMNAAQLADAVSRGDRSELLNIVRNKPKLWILNYRIRALWGALSPIIESSYVRVYPNVLLSGTALRPGRPVHFENRWPGSYRAYSADGKPIDAMVTIDGIETRLPAFVPQGGHDVVWNGAPGTEDLFLLPANAKLGELRKLPPPFDLYADVYD